MKNGDKIICTKEHKGYSHVYEVGEVLEAMSEPYISNSKLTIMISLDQDRYDFGNPLFFKVFKE